MWRDNIFVLRLLLGSICSGVVRRGPTRELVTTWCVSSFSGIWLHAKRPTSTCEGGSGYLLGSIGVVGMILWRCN